MPKLTRRRVVGGGLALGAVGAAGYGMGWFKPREAPGSRGVDFNAPQPMARADLNLLIIMVDQERAWDTLPPNLDLPNHSRIAELGTHFTNMHVTCPLCTPSRSVFWTGQHVQRTKVQDNIEVPFIGRALDPAIPTLGHMLRDAGFYTAYKGKWHLSDLPHDREWEFAQDRPGALEKYGFSDYGWGPEAIETQAGWKFDGRIASDAGNWLAKTSPTLDNPWALTVSFVNPHDIMFFDATGKQAKQRVQNVFPGPVSPLPEDALYCEGDWTDLPRNFRPAAHGGHVPTQADYEQFMDYFYGPMPFEDAEAWVRFAQYYYNCIRDVDRHIGTVLDALEASGQADNTVIVLVSDHGEMGGVHGLRQKGPWMYRENLAVPFVVSHPDARASRKNAGIVSAVDFTPTLLGCVGLDASATKSRYSALKGTDISGEVTTSTTDRSRSGQGALVTYSVSHHADPDFAKIGLANQASDSTLEKLGNTLTGGLPDHSKRAFMRGIVTDDYKFARYFSPRDHHTPADLDELEARNDLELFDRKNDPGETRNLADDAPAHAAVLADLNERLNALVAAEVGIDDGSDLPGPSSYWRG